VSTKHEDELPKPVPGTGANNNTKAPKKKTAPTPVEKKDSTS
jgi:hypothetical protein